MHSGLDAYAWRRLCSLFKLASQDLCHALAAVGKKICSSNVHPEDISTFVACHLIPLDKNPGVRQIGVGEVPRRIIAKAISFSVMTYKMQLVHSRYVQDRKVVVRLRYMPCVSSLLKMRYMVFYW